MSKCKCGDEMEAEPTTLVRQVRGTVVVTRAVPSEVCEMCARRTVTDATARNLDTIREALPLPGVGSVTVDYMRIVAHLDEVGALPPADPTKPAIVLT